jgi:O-antigen/teichoic acid export membrane protein
MSRTRKFIGSTIYGYLWQGATMLVGLWLTPFYLRHLGQTDYGLWLAGLQVLSIVLLMDFGVVAILPRDVARLQGLIHSGGKTDDLIALVRKSTNVVLYQTLIVSAAALAVCLYWPGLSKEIRGPVSVAAVAFCISFPLRLYPGIMEGLQDLEFLAQLRIGVWAAATMLTVALVLMGWSLYALAVGWSFNTLVLQLLALLRLRRTHAYLVRFKDWLFPARPHLQDFARGAWISVEQLAQILRDGTSLIILAKILGPASVVVFVATDKLIGIFGQQASLLVLNALPGLSELRTSAPKAKLQSVTTSLTLAMLLLSGGIASVAFAVNESFVTLWVGPTLYAGAAVSALITGKLLCRHLDLCLALSLFATGHERTLAIKTLLDGILTTASAFLLIYWTGLYGAVLCQLAGVVLAGLPIGIYLYCKEFEVSPKRALAPFAPLLVCILVAALSGRWLETFLKPTTYIGIAGLAGVVGVLYLGMAIPYAMRTPLWAHIRSILDRFPIPGLSGGGGPKTSRDASGAQTEEAAYLEPEDCRKD